MIAALPHSSKGIRDRALLLLGFAGALRRSELVALDVTDVTPSDNGLVVMLRRSKTDQEGRGPYGRHPVRLPPRNLPRPGGPDVAPNVRDHRRADLSSGGPSTA